MPTTRLGWNINLWLKIARKFRYGPNWTPSVVDFMKSSLLQRLVDGKEPFKVPPPRSFSYPWYQIIENGKAYFGGHSFPDIHIGGDTWSICQCPWMYLGTENDLQYLSYTGVDAWVYRPVHEGELARTGTSVRTGAPTPIYATHCLERVDREEVWGLDEHVR